MIGTHKVEMVTAIQPLTCAVCNNVTKMMLLIKKPNRETAKNLKNEPFCAKVK